MGITSKQRVMGKAILYNVAWSIFILWCAARVKGEAAHLALAAFLFITVQFARVEDLMLQNSINQARVGNSRFLLQAEHLGMNCVEDVRTAMAELEAQQLTFAILRIPGEVGSWISYLTALFLVVSSLN